MRTVPAVPYRDPNNYVKLSGRIAEEIRVRFGPINLITAPTVRPTPTPPARKFGSNAKAGWMAGLRPQALGAPTPAWRFISSSSQRLCAVCWPIPMAVPCTAGPAPVNSGEGSSVTEGIGNSRITANLEGAPVDEAIRIDDQTTMMCSTTSFGMKASFWVDRLASTWPRRWSWPGA